VEGLAYYLPEQSVFQLFADIASLGAPGSRLHFDFLHLDCLLGDACPPAYRVTAQVSRPAVLAWFKLPGWMCPPARPPARLPGRPLQQQPL
jgi:O-methyltransferase involved in polyketide biosynthesis